MKALQVYPNPAKDILNIEWPQSWVGSATAVIYDLQGREITSILPSEQITQIDLSHVAAGNYVLKVITPDGVGTSNLILTK